MKMLTLLAILTFAFAATANITLIPNRRTVASSQALTETQKKAVSLFQNLYKCLELFQKTETGRDRYRACVNSHLAGAIDSSRRDKLAAWLLFSFRVTEPAPCPAERAEKVRFLPFRPKELMCIDIEVTKDDIRDGFVFYTEEKGKLVIQDIRY